LKSYLQQILGAQQTISPVALNTPLVLSHVLSDVFGFRVYLKLENLQVTGAFKIRGCFNKMANLPKRTSGIVAASSGSHGIASAFAAKLCGFEAKVVMPSTSPEVKRKRVKGYGASLIIHGTTYDDAYEVAKDMAAEEGKVFVPSFDDLDIVLGQATIALEIAQQLPDVDFVAAPIGGGGLYAGLLLAFAELKPELAVWGVQAEGAPSMAVSVNSGRIERLASISTVADAIAVKAPGKVPFEIIHRYSSGIATVSDDAIVEATGRLALWAKVMAEPAAAAALAVDWTSVLGHKPKEAVFVISGGNVSKEVLAKAMAEVSDWPAFV